MSHNFKITRPGCSLSRLQARNSRQGLVIKVVTTGLPTLSSLCRRRRGPCGSQREDKSHPGRHSLLLGSPPQETLDLGAFMAGARSWFLVGPKGRVTGTQGLAVRPGFLGYNSRQDKSFRPRSTFVLEAAAVIQETWGPHGQGEVLYPPSKQRKRGWRMKTSPQELFE